MRHAIVDPSQSPALVLNVIDYEADISGQTPPGFEPPIIAERDAAGTASPGWHFANGAFVNPDPAPVLVCPPTITKRQMLLWLMANKGKTEADILAAIDTIADPTAKAEAEIAFKYPDANILHRDSPLFDQLGSLFSMTAADIDAAFTAAAAL